MGKKKLLNFFVFMILLGWIFVHATYLFRNCTNDRVRVNGIRNEENLDVVCIGGSSTFVYWEPYLAWKEYGMTSYDLATNSAIPPLINGYVRYLSRIHEPDLVVIDVRSFTEDAGSIIDSEGAVRNMTDSLPLSAVRFQTVTETLKYFDAFEDDNADVVSYYFDISKYHGNYERLGSETNWNYISNDCTSEYNGFGFIYDPCHAIIEEPAGYQTEEQKELNPAKEACLREILEYFNEKNMDALFVAGPIPITKDIKMQYNAVGEIVSSYGYRFLDTNDHYQEMHMDFSKDFYNTGHVNVYGAEKYTRFVADYIKKNYQIDDHRGDERFQEWEDEYLSAKKKDYEVKKLIDQQAAAKEKANNIGRDLAKTDDFIKWSSIASNENYTVFLLSKGAVPEVDMYNMPWNISENARNIIRIYSGNTVIYESDLMLDSAYESVVGTDEKKYAINCGAKSELTVDGRRYNTEEKGMYILVFDNNYNQVLDVVWVTDDEEGNVLKHIG